MGWLSVSFGPLGYSQLSAWITYVKDVLLILLSRLHCLFAKLTEEYLRLNLLCKLLVYQLFWLFLNFSAMYFFRIYTWGLHKSLDHMLLELKEGSIGPKDYNIMEVNTQLHCRISHDKRACQAMWSWVYILETRFTMWQQRFQNLRNIWVWMSQVQKSFGEIFNTPIPWIYARQALG